MIRHKKRLCALLCTFLLIFTLALQLVQPALAASYQQGDTGNAVTTIQTKLRRWGYFDGPVDGIYGSGTAKAVRYFQQSNGLTPGWGSRPRHIKGPGHGAAKQQLWLLLGKYEYR